MTYSFRLVAAALLLSTAPAFADPALLSPSQYTAALMMPAPAADGSAEQQHELAEIKAIQAKMSTADFAKAQSDNDNESVSAFAEVFGPWFDLTKLPKTAALFAVVRKEEDTAGKAVKTYFHRNRPWHLDETLKTCERGKNVQTSYPSGHATMGYSMAVVLSHLLPDQADAIMSRAKSYGENRLVCGDHYRSDIVAGQVLGTVVANELLANPAFQPTFEAAKSELATARSAAH
ncbi:MAG: phosphatase PAP2 family protein [Rhizomicrobium sp.]|nr:phosphatase PAP2 family protein [Rhizomicrobium sp.]